MQTIFVNHIDDDRTPAVQAALAQCNQHWNKNALEKGWTAFSAEETSIADKIGAPDPIRAPSDR